MTSKAFRLVLDIDHRRHLFMKVMRLQHQRLCMRRWSAQMNLCKIDMTSQQVLDYLEKYLMCGQYLNPRRSTVQQLVLYMDRIDKRS